MALIICPECGKQVSGSAVSCPNCGYPIASSNPVGRVVIKICGGLVGTVKVINTRTKQLLWSGKAGQIAEFTVNGETPIGVTWGVSNNPNSECCATVKARERYSLTWRQGFFTSTVCLNKVDVIDSE